MESLRSSLDYLEFKENREIAIITFDSQLCFYYIPNKELNEAQVICVIIS